MCVCYQEFHQVSSIISFHKKLRPCPAYVIDYGSAHTMYWDAFCSDPITNEQLKVSMKSLSTSHLIFLNLSRATWYVYLIATKYYSEFRLQKRLQAFFNSCPLIRRITHDACWCQTWPELNFIEAVVHWDAINSALQLKICESHPPLAISHSTSR